MELLTVFQMGLWATELAACNEAHANIEQKRHRDKHRQTQRNYSSYLVGHWLFAHEASLERHEKDEQSQVLELAPNGSHDPVDLLVQQRFI